MKKPEVKSIMLIIYLQVILVLYFVFLYPALASSKNLSPTNIPSLSVMGLRQANNLFDDAGKVWAGVPTEPNLGNYSYGQTDPIQ